jgi:hypothetical protein
MTGRRFQDIWKDQCEAARGVREQHGVISALEYLIGEKLMTYAETAVGRPEFARELPRFVAEIRSIFSAEEIRLYLQHLERMAAQEEEALSADPAQPTTPEPRQTCAK